MREAERGEIERRRDLELEGRLRSGDGDRLGVGERPRRRLCVRERDRESPAMLTILTAAEMLLRGAMSWCSERSWCCIDAFRNHPCRTGAFWEHGPQITWMDS